MGQKRVELLMDSALYDVISMNNRLYVAYFPSLKKENRSHKITMLSMFFIYVYMFVWTTFQILSQITNFQETWYDDYAILSCFSVVLSNSNTSVGWKNAVGK
jgi:uncharacterized membrane protein YbjE (DUF340 family)